MVDSQCCVSFGRAYMLSYSVMSDSVTPWTVAHQAPPAMEFSRQEYWSGVPFPSPGDLPDPGIEPGSPALFSSVQSLSRVQLLSTSRTAARQASLSFTISRSLLKLIFTELVMLSTHVILCHPLLLLPSFSPSIRVFSNE